MEYPQFYCKETGEGEDEDELSLIFTVSSIAAENYTLDFNFNPVIRVFVHQQFPKILMINNTQYIHNIPSNDPHREP